MSAVHNYDSTQSKQLINASTSSDDLRAKLAEKHGADNVFNTVEATDKFAFEAFMAPFALVKRKSDGARGTLEFTHSPRYYFDFKETK